MFGKDFFPTPDDIIEQMVSGITLQGKTILEPSAGKGNIIDFLKRHGAEVIACERHADLRTIVATKCKVIADDFFDVNTEDVSHIHAIIMNPPFSNQERHILHAWNVAPPGCIIVSLCNTTMINNGKRYGTGSQEEIKTLIGRFGHSIDLGNCFHISERTTEVEVSMITMQKPGADYEQEFEGFFTSEDEEHATGEGLMSYNSIRDLVNRYVEAVKLFDKELDIVEQISTLTNTFYNSHLGVEISNIGKPVVRADFKKDLQKAGWRHIFDKMNLTKIATKGLKEDINKFVEQQTQIPFTMRNIYRMLEIVIGTTGQRMDKALIEVFEKLTVKYSYRDDMDANRYYHNDQWKTNSHYLLGKRFVMPYLVQRGYHVGRPEPIISSNSNFEIIEDLLKALCYITGDNYEKFIDLETYLRYPYKLINSENKYVFGSYGRVCAEHRYEDFSRGVRQITDGTTIIKDDVRFGSWSDWTYFRIKCFMKGTIHFEFKSEELWAQFNQRIGKIKGYPLFEARPQSKYQERQTGRSESRKRTADASYQTLGF